MQTDTGRQTTWKGAPVFVSARQVPRFAWQSASIDVTIANQVVLCTGGVLKTVGAHTEMFSLDGHAHEATVTWGKAALRSFPYRLSIDGATILESRVPVANWWLALWPWALVVAFVLWRLVS